MKTTKKNELADLLTKYEKEIRKEVTKEITIKIWNKIASYEVVANSREANIILQQAIGERYIKLSEQRRKIQRKIDLLYETAGMINE